MTCLRCQRVTIKLFQKQRPLGEATSPRKDPLPVKSPVHDVVISARVFDTKGTGHAAKDSRGKKGSKQLKADLTPYSGHLDVHIREPEFLFCFNPLFIFSALLLIFQFYNARNERFLERSEAQWKKYFSI